VGDAQECESMGVMAQQCFDRKGVIERKEVTGLTDSFMKEYSMELSVCQ
jgi:hypothetical protein